MRFPLHYWTKLYPLSGGVSIKIERRNPQMKEFEKL